MGRVAYFYDADVGNFYYAQGHPMKPHRMRMTHNLLVAYGVMDKLDVFTPPRSTEKEMTRFHADEYISFLKTVTPDSVPELHNMLQRFNVLEDCPVFDGLYEYCQIAAGGSLAGAARLNSGDSTVALNWAGGLHHAKKAEASGFCYINDCVLAILELLKVHARVLYVDIDIHHGDGVEEAFYSTDRVMTASFHKFGGFFPGTGAVDDVGSHRGKYYSVNFPLRDGIDDESYREIFLPVMSRIMEWYRPGAVVLQCGADSLTGDRLGCFNLSLRGHAQCVDFFKAYNVPLLLLGGGGYTIRNVARCWTYETSRVLDMDLDDSLPFNDNLEFYAPEFRLHITPSNMENHNTRAELEKNKCRILEHLRSLPSAPSVPMADIPRASPLGIHRRDETEGDPDMRPRQRMRAKMVVEYEDSDDEAYTGGDDLLGNLPSARRRLKRPGMGIAVARKAGRASTRTVPSSVRDDHSPPRAAAAPPASLPPFPPHLPYHQPKSVLIDPAKRPTSTKEMVRGASVFVGGNGLKTHVPGVGSTPVSATISAPCEKPALSESKEKDTAGSQRDKRDAKEVGHSKKVVPGPQKNAIDSPSEKSAKPSQSEKNQDSPSDKPVSEKESHTRGISAVAATVDDPSVGVSEKPKVCEETRGPARSADAVEPDRQTETVPDEGAVVGTHPLNVPNANRGGENGKGTLVTVPGDQNASRVLEEKGRDNDAVVKLSPSNKSISLERNSGNAALEEKGKLDGFVSKNVPKTSASQPSPPGKAQLDTHSEVQKASGDDKDKMDVEGDEGKLERGEEIKNVKVAVDRDGSGDVTMGDAPSSETAADPSLEETDKAGPGVVSTGGANDDSGDSDGSLKQKDSPSHDKDGPVSGADKKEKSDPVFPRNSERPAGKTSTEDVGRSVARADISGQTKIPGKEEHDAANETVTVGKFGGGAKESRSLPAEPVKSDNVADETCKDTARDRVDDTPGTGERSETKPSSPTAKGPSRPPNPPLALPSRPLAVAVEAPKPPGRVVLPTTRPLSAGVPKSPNVGLLAKAGSANSTSTPSPLTAAPSVPTGRRRFAPAGVSPPTGRKADGQAPSPAASVPASSPSSSAARPDVSKKPDRVPVLTPSGRTAANSSRSESSADKPKKIGSSHSLRGEGDRPADTSLGVVKVGEVGKGGKKPDSEQESMKGEAGRGIEEPAKGGTDMDVNESRKAHTNVDIEDDVRGGSGSRGDAGSSDHQEKMVDSNVETKGNVVGLKRGQGEGEGKAAERKEGKEKGLTEKEVELKEPKGLEAKESKLVEEESKSESKLSEKKEEVTKSEEPKKTEGKDTKPESEKVRTDKNEDGSGRERDTVVQGDGNGVKPLRKEREKAKDGPEGQSSVTGAEDKPEARQMGKVGKVTIKIPVSGPATASLSKGNERASTVDGNKSKESKA